MLGYVYSVYCHKPDEALGYLSDVLMWLTQIHAGMKIPGTVSWMDKGDAVLLSACAQMAALVGNMDRAREWLIRARTLAEQFDAAPCTRLTSRNMRYFHGDDSAVSYDDFGETALQAVERNLADQDVAPLLTPIWNEIAKA